MSNADDKPDHPPAENFIQPSILVKVSKKANRDEVTGAVARALTNTQVSFFDGRTSGIPGESETPPPGELTSDADTRKLDSLDAAATPEDTLSIVVQSEGN